MKNWNKSWFMKILNLEKFFFFRLSEDECRITLNQQIKIYTNNSFEGITDRNLEKLCKYLPNMTSSTYKYLVVHFVVSINYYV